MSADGCEVIQSDGDRTADGMAARWKLVRPEPATLRLEPSEPFWEVLEFTVQVERTVDSPGLGIMLEEYGSDDSGAGLTLVTGVVEGGNAAMASTALLPGDAIASACGANTEGLNYDGTIDALCSLPAAPAPAVLTVKRLRKVRAKKPQRRIDDFVKARAPAASPHFASAPAPPVAPTAPQPPSAPTTPRPPPASGVDPRTLLPVKAEYVGPPTAGGSSSSDDESSGERTEAYPHSPARDESLAVGAAVEVVSVSNAEFNGRRGVVAETPPELVARERVLVTVGDRTLSLKRRNVVAAPPASPAPQPTPLPPPPTPTKTSTQSAAARPPPPPPPSATPTKKSPALAKFLAGGVRDTTPVKKKRGSAKALSSPPPKKSKKKVEPASAALAADFFSGKVKDATKPPKKKARKKKGGPGPCARAGAAPAVEASDDDAEEESLAAGVEIVAAEDLLAGDLN